MIKDLNDFKNNGIIYYILSEITNDIENGKYIYQNEHQFQFDLAWKINKKIDNNYLNIFIEYKSIKKSCDYSSCYTDLIIKDKDNNYIPIELKYKKHGMRIIDKDGQVTDELEHDGAVNLGKFDYLWDIHRIENLKYKMSKIDCLNRLKDCVCGYAIMITNDKLYWNTSKNNCSYKMSLCGKIKEIRWSHTTSNGLIKQAKSIMSSKKYFNSLDINEISNYNIDNRRIELKKEYNFSNEYAEKSKKYAYKKFFIEGQPLRFNNTNKNDKKYGNTQNIEFRLYIQEI